MALIVRSSAPDATPFSHATHLAPLAGDDPHEVAGDQSRRGTAFSGGLTSWPIAVAVLVGE